MDQTGPIGQLSFHQSGRQVVATLDESLRWRCDDRGCEQLLNELFQPIEVTPCDVHRPELHALYQAAERLGGEVILPEECCAA